MAGPSASYDFATDQSHTTGELTTGFIHDSGRRLTDILGRPISANRGIVEWTHRQIWVEHLTLNAEVNYWSDSEVLRDFRAREFFRCRRRIRSPS